MAKALMPGLIGVSTFIYDGTPLLRSYGTLPHPNILGFFLSISLFSSVYLFQKTQNRKLRLAIFAGAALVIFLGLLLSFSRLFLVLACVRIRWLGILGIPEGIQSKNSSPVLPSL